MSGVSSEAGVASSSHVGANSETDSTHKPSTALKVVQEQNQAAHPVTTSKVRMNTKIYAEQVNWAKRVKEMKQRKREEARAAESAECTFSPDIKITQIKSSKHGPKKELRSSSISSDGHGSSAHVARMKKAYGQRLDKQARIIGKPYGQNWKPVTTVPVPFNLALPKCVPNEPCTSPTCVKRVAINLEISDVVNAWTVVEEGDICDNSSNNSSETVVIDEEWGAIEDEHTVNESSNGAETIVKRVSLSLNYAHEYAAASKLSEQTDLNKNQVRTHAVNENVEEETKEDPMTDRDRNPGNKSNVVYTHGAWENTHNHRLKEETDKLRDLTVERVDEILETARVDVSKLLESLSKASSNRQKKHTLHLRKEIENTMTKLCAKVTDTLSNMNYADHAKQE